MSTKKIALAGTALLLLGVPVYQQTRIHSLEHQLASLPAAAPRKAISSAAAIAQSPAQIPVHSPGASAKNSDTTTEAAEPRAGGALAKLKPNGSANGSAEGALSGRGNDVILKSSRTGEGHAGVGPASVPGSPAIPDDGEAEAAGDPGQRAPRTSGGLVQWDHTQATGPPDTPEAGDKPTAWAPLNPRSGEQWLQLGYEKAVTMKEINIHESHSSGAISKVTAITPNGTEKTLWTGRATPGAGNEILETAVPVPSGVTGNQIKVYVDTDRVGSWPEIDAVELVGTDGSRQWASNSSASSSYSQIYTNQGSIPGTAEYESTARTRSTESLTRGGN